MYTTTLPVVAFVLGLIATTEATALQSGPGWSVHDQLPYGYYESEITWTGFPEVGVETELHGTIQQIMGKHPDIEKSLRKSMAERSRDNGTSESREGDPPSDNMKFICNDRNIGVTWAVMDVCVAGIQYLKGLPDDRICGNQAAHDGKGACGRISCSWDVGIWWCNDNDHDVKYRCNIFGEFASQIVQRRECTAGQDNFGKPLQAYGQAFDLDNGVNVIMGNKYNEC